MSQYKGNQTDGAFNPTYKPDGETSGPINVVSTSMEINGNIVEGYQATYANGTSKWTAAAHTDDLWDNDRFDNSTFTGKQESDGSWTWKPTSKNSVKNLANDYKGPDGEKISEESIKKNFYNKKGLTTQKKLNTTQNNALKAEYGENLSTVKDGKFADRVEGESLPQTNADGSVDIKPMDMTDAIKATKIRREYGNYYYPQDIQSNKQDRIIFKMKESTGKVIDPSVKTNVKAFQRKAGEIGGSVTLPIPSGIKDSNMVDWGKGTMNPLQAGAAAGMMNVMEAAGSKDKDMAEEATKALAAGKTALQQDKAVAKGINAYIAGQATQTQNLLSRATGAIANPNMELLFNAPGLRAFDFTFQLSPRDSSEAAHVRNIINFFKQGMSVKTTSTNIFLKAPNYFEIDYVTFSDNGAMMKHPSLNIIKTFALLTCSVDYTPNNSYMTYSDPERSMVQYTLNLQFSELDPIYESDYYEGLGMQDGTNVQEIGF